MTRLVDAIGGWRLGTRLFVAQAIVLLAIVASAGLTAALIGPPLFHAHLIDTNYPPDSPQIFHIERAYADASLISLTVGLLVALAASLGISWYLTRRIGRPVELLTQAAARLSRGDYDARVTVQGGGPELSTLGDTFNTMADRLNDVEATRRRLLADLAHEMRTPIATLNAHLEGVADGVLAWDDNTRAIVEQQVERLTRLARDLEEVSRAEEGRVELQTSLQPLTDLVEPVIRQTRNAYDRKGVTLTAAVDDLPVRADPQRFAQILGNLLNNALRHTPQGGRVDVTSTTTPDTVVISVTDTGQGMSEEQLAHIFERFYRGDSARESDRGGSGIGLTIAKALAEAHGGSLTATSAGEGQGSTLRLTLPRGLHQPGPGR
ncbi:MAG: HAMP domain-containing sensor histidine kinase [Propionicimonas sp.]|jgi:signal transduction histidine kinase|uniref:sensor histidine kinase n=1 Tax=Propionicimonas sp. TaxID=1955623 RepID=UPI002B1E9310|nr:HAMP domain-containing sensor histidine kinase [Propionicimonas sp.]MEA4944105.1 HAMP domain-containing sensor histidine kinase [Propionicimonas sp.]MEA5055548.1 HAMP domain-containing sensor histidine kinase [Propionicimonas sp.]